MERDAVLLVIRELESLAGGSEPFQFTQETDGLPTGFRPRRPGFALTKTP